MTTAAESVIDAELRLLLAMRGRRYDSDSWHREGRPEQQWPDGDWVTWLTQAGRGWGKTRTGSEVTNQVATYPQELLGVPADGLRIALTARTAADVRDTMVEGVAGILATGRPWNRPHYEPSKRRITWPNGAMATTFSADAPDLLRGPQHHFAWVDEAGAFERNGEEAWDNLMLGLRGGDRPRVLVTTTPRRNKLMRRLLKLKHLHVTRGRTQDNAPNLADTFLEEIVSRYEGTRLGRQEIEGELLEDREGALWTLDLIDRYRISDASKLPEDLRRVVVAIDPAGGGGDEIGIIVAAKGRDGHYYVLADLSGMYSPEGWGRATVKAYQDWKADRVVYERNFGGDMVEATIRNIQRVPTKAVTASRGKAVRAEPISALYERGMVHHVGSFRELENQMTEWAPGDSDSPDRMDALVWALTELSSGGGWTMR